jgi:glutamate synthase domain-containing protein 3
MTGGRIVILGPTGRNFAAGMSGGIAYVLDRDGTFPARCNTELVGFDEIGAADAIELHELVEEHHLRTLSPVAARILEDWDRSLPRFVKVMPHDYKRALADLSTAERAMRADAEEPAVADAVGVPHTGTSRQS